MSTKMSQEAKKDEFRKYLEKAGVLELLTKSLVQLYEEPDKPGDAVNYLKNTVGGTPEDKKTIEELRTENSQLKAKLAELEKSQSELQSRISSLETKDTSEPAAAAADTVEEMTPAGDSESPAAETAAVEPAETETPAAPETSEAPVAAESEEKLALEPAAEPMDTDVETPAPVTETADNTAAPAATDDVTAAPAEDPAPTVTTEATDEAKTDA
eukprot:TRINITY_DN23590_c0_g1_i2.p1 TRINITY_DN23590_c0_g1~~TRINITY_DN23590_c0_g1_i2.p1  ORF type:complete len:214 (-),score=98.78 TRINITY_DN23590_c0_g1_i2:156-797(-)